MLSQQYSTGHFLAVEKHLADASEYWVRFNTMLANKKLLAKIMRLHRG